MMAFSSFVILAEMRTGSNLLESNLNAFAGIACEGELFNPDFISDAETTERHGITAARRDRDPLALLAAVRDKAQGLSGFRLFHNHDRRIWDHVLADPACAKVVLTRNPLDSFVSLKIAEATNQWKMGDVRGRGQAQVTLWPEEFEAYLSQMQEVQMDIQRRLQTSGQSAFYIHYDDANDLEVLHGLVRWLGVGTRIADVPRYMKKQNPEPMEQKLANPEVLAQVLARLDRFDTSRTPNFEARRGPFLPAIHAGAATPLVFLPVRGAPEGAVIDWLARLDGVARDALPRSFDQGRLDAWRRAHPGFRSFAVVRHPLLRAHDAFVRKVLTGEFREVREHMARLFGVVLDGVAPLNPDDHRTAFKAYLRFAAASVQHQTRLQPWPMWATQIANLEGYAQVILPDLILREETLAEDLAALARRMGQDAPPPYRADPTPGLPLSAVLDDEVVALSRAAWQRDHHHFGFADLPERGLE